jgi:hypothetical protein
MLDDVRSFEANVPVVLTEAEIEQLTFTCG